jgi:hypothetical protein
MEGSVGALIVDGQSELYTKSAARELAFAANRAGCAFIGRRWRRGQLPSRTFRCRRG